MPKRHEIEIALRRLAPKIPSHEFGAVVDHAVDSRGLRHAAPEEAAWLSLVAYVRHTFTDYDAMRDEDYVPGQRAVFVARQIERRPGRVGRTAAVDGGRTTCR